MKRIFCLNRQKTTSVASLPRPRLIEKAGVIPSTPDEILSDLGSTLGDAVEERMEAVGEGIMALDDRVESAKVSVGVSVATFDDRVERARASVETALNELVR